MFYLLLFSIFLVVSVRFIIYLIDSFDLGVWFYRRVDHKHDLYHKVIFMDSAMGVRRRSVLICRKCDRVIYK